MLPFSAARCRSSGGWAATRSWCRTAGTGAAPGVPKPTSDGTRIPSTTPRPLGLPGRQLVFDPLSCRRRATVVRAGRRRDTASAGSSVVDPGSAVQIGRSVSHLSWLEAGVMGVVQGVSELFPISSVGHSVLLPAFIGGQWARDLNVATPESPYLAFIVGMHVATALALVVFFRRDWVRVIAGLLTSVRDRGISTVDQRLAWLLVLATIPVGIVGLLFEHAFRTIFAQPVPASAFLIGNGAVLLGGERLRRRTPEPRSQGGTLTAPGTATPRPGKPPTSASPDTVLTDQQARASDTRLATVGFRDGTLIGTTQILALFAGFSRSGAAMVAGLIKGLSHEDAARLSFLMSVPVIAAAGVLKIPDLFGPLGDGIRGQVLFGSVLAGIAAYLSVRFLVRYFTTRTLTPFAIYCLLAGFVCLFRFTLI